MKRDTAINIRNVPADIRQAVIEAARVEDASVNDVVGKILGDRYGLVWEPSHASFADSTSEQWVIRMPAVLKHTIAAHADSVGGRQTGVVLLALALHFGLPTPSVRNRVRPPERQLESELLAELLRRAGEGESIRALEREHGLPRMTLNRAIQRDQEARR